MHHGSLVKILLFDAQRRYILRKQEKKKFDSSRKYI